MYTANYRMHHEAHAQKLYTLLRTEYEKLGPNEQRGHRDLLNEIRMTAAIYNHDRALFDKSYKNWKKDVLGALEAVGEGRMKTDVRKLDDDTTSSDYIEDDTTVYTGSYGETKGEEAYRSLADIIKCKRNNFEQFYQELTEIGWWT